MFCQTLPRGYGSQDKAASASSRCAAVEGLAAFTAQVSSWARTVSHRGPLRAVATSASTASRVLTLSFALAANSYVGMMIDVGHGGDGIDERCLRSPVRFARRSATNAK